VTRDCDATLLMLLTAVILAGCSPTAAVGPPRPTATSSASWDRLPRIATGQICPATPTVSTHSWLGTTYDLAAIGDGPGYAVVFDNRWRFDNGSSWGYTKVLWLADSNHPGPVLLRGRQLDGSGDLGFGTDDPPRSEMIWTIGGGTSDLPSYIRGKSPGCYGVQLDGRGFSERIVFMMR